MIPLAGGVGDLETMRLHDLPNMRKGPITLGVCAVDAAGNVADRGALTASYSGAPVAITDNSTASVTLSVTEGVIIEHIYVTIEGSHTYMGDLTIQLESPTGEIFDLFLNELGNNDLNGTWVFGVSGALGVSSVGDWTIHITDNANFDEGSLTGVELDDREIRVDVANPRPERGGGGDCW